MNSHQRRKERREWRHVVQVEPCDWERYLAMFKWCQKNFGPCVDDGWRDPRPVYHAKWVFNCPRKAVEFALKWK